jgi:hypothetical protein
MNSTTYKETIFWKIACTYYNIGYEAYLREYNIYHWHNEERKVCGTGFEECYRRSKNQWDFLSYAFFYVTSCQRIWEGDRDSFFYYIENRGTRKPYVEKKYKKYTEESSAYIKKPHHKKKKDNLKEEDKVFFKNKKYKKTPRLRNFSYKKKRKFNLAKERRETKLKLKRCKNNYEDLIDFNEKKYRLHKWDYCWY